MSAPYPEKTDYPAEAPPAYPAGGQPYPPQGGQPYPPQGGQPYPPQGGQPYPSQGGQPYPPQGGQPYPPQGVQQYPPQGYPPQGQGAPPPPNYNAQYAAPKSGVPQPGVQYTAVPQTTVIVRETQVQPNDYLAFAICVTVCCCLPFGIVAIVKSMDVRNRHQGGDFAGAEAASRSAKNWSIAGLVTGIIINVAVIIFIIVYYVVILAAVASTYPY